MIDVLAVGHAPILSINRRFYRVLPRRGLSVELAVPASLPFASPAVEPRRDGDPPVHFLAPRGAQTRFWTFDGLTALLDARMPRFVLLENEPDSRMAWEIGGWTRRNGAKLLCISNENDLPPPLITLLQGESRRALRSLRSRIWSLAARRRVDHVFAICNDGVTAMGDLGFGGRVTRIPLGFDPNPTRPYRWLGRLQPALFA